MRLDAKCLKLFGSRFGAGWIVATVEVSVHGQAGLSSGGANEVEDLLIAVERFAGPVLGISEKRRCSMGFHFEAPVG